MLKSKAPEFWRSLESYRYTMIAANIVSVIVVISLLLIIKSQKPFYVIRVDSEGSSKLLVNDTEFNGPKFKELKKYSQDFIISYLGLDSEKVVQRLAKAQSMMTNEFLFTQHKNKYSDKEFIEAVRLLDIKTNFIFEKITLKKIEHELYHLKVDGINIKTKNKTNTVSELRFISYITLVQQKRTRNNPSGLKVHKFEFNYYDEQGRIITQ